MSMSGFFLSRAEPIDKCPGGLSISHNGFVEIDNAEAVVRQHDYYRPFRRR